MMASNDLSIADCSEFTDDQNDPSTEYYNSPYKTSTELHSLLDRDTITGERMTEYEAAEQLLNLQSYLQASKNGGEGTRLQTMLHSQIEYNNNTNLYQELTVENENNFSKEVLVNK